MHVDFSCHACITPGSRGARLDGIYDTKDVRIILELDEHYHAEYPALCETRRQEEVVGAMRAAGETRHIAWLRVNPHAGPDWGEKVSRGLEKRRHLEAIEIIEDLVSVPRDGVFYVGYPPERVSELETRS